MAGLGSPTPSHTQNVGLHLLFFLRFIQLGSVTITGFIYCYLVWHHNNHYCVYYPWACTDVEMSWVKVPWEYKLVITARPNLLPVHFAFLESYISTAYFLHQRQMPNYRNLLCTTTPVAAVFAPACRAIFTNRFTSMDYRWFFPIWESWRSNVEQKNIAMVVDGQVSLSIAVGFTALIFLMSAIVVVSQYIQEKRNLLSVEPSAVEHMRIEGDKEKVLVKV